MSSKKCISLENFDPDDLVFDYVKEGKMSDGTSFSKTPISVLRRDEWDDRSLVRGHGYLFFVWYSEGF